MLQIYLNGVAAPLFTKAKGPKRLRMCSILYFAVSALFVQLPREQATLANDACLIKLDQS